jgi:tetratricopeptide (TPR) repeat protein
MITSALFITEIILLGWLIPFAGDDSDAERDLVTIESLEDRVIELPEASTSPATAQSALAHYRQFLKMGEGAPEMRMEAMRRLGDLSLKVGEDRSIADPDYASDMALHRDAILLYEQLLERYKDYAQADEVLYQLARAYESAGQPEQALSALDRLVVEFPKSKFADEGQFRRGEILFQRKSYFDAGMAYEAVINHGESSQFFRQALYKHGWSLFKQGEYDVGIESFLDLVELHLAGTNASGLQHQLNALSRADRELLDDSLRVLSLTFSYEGGQEAIGRYLDNRQESEVDYLLYTGLAELYMEKERYLDAASAYSGFIDREPFHGGAPLLMMREIDAYKAGNFPSLVLDAKQEFVREYGLTSDYWSFHDPEKRPDVIKPLKKNLSDLAQFDHARAQKTGDPEAYARAADWYRRYLEYFPEDPDSAQRSFLLAELLMESKAYGDANFYYAQAAYGYPDYPQAASAGYAALLAAQAEEDRSQGAVADEWHQKQMSQAVRFVQSFPAHEEAAAVLTDTAESYYSGGQVETAILLAGEIIRPNLDVSDAQRRIAWTVAAHGHFDLEHYGKAERAYLQLRDLGGAPGLRPADIDERIAAAVYRQAESAQAAGNIDAAVADYLRVAQVAPQSSIRATSTYDAAALLISNSQWDEAINVLQGFRRDFPGHKFADEVTQKLAVAYTETGQSANAAAEFERIAAMPSVGAAGNREALWSAAELYESSCASSDARRTWKRYVEIFPLPVAPAIEAREKLAFLAREAGADSDRRYWLAEIIGADATAGKARTDRTRTLAAKAALELAEPKRLAFGAVRLRIPLDESLKQKKALMESALKAYNEAAGYEIAEITTVATFRVAEIYHQLSTDLMSSERPGGLSADELEQYEILLEEQAFPFEEKAIELYEVNASRSVAGVFDKWVAASFEKLAVLLPARYAKFEKAEDYVAELY